MTNGPKDYVAIIVRREVLNNARNASASFLADYRLKYNDWRLNAIRDLVDPLPEPDVDGITPIIVGE